MTHTSPHRRGMTLIEILIVITVIAVLAGLLLTAVPRLAYNARALDTAGRMQGLLQAATLATSQEGGCASFLQRAIPSFGGTAVMRISASGQLTGATWHRCWPEDGSNANDNHCDNASGKPLVLSYPWGKNRTYFLFETWYVTGKTLAGSFPAAGSSTAWPARPWPTLPVPVVGANNWATAFTPAKRSQWETPEPIGLSSLRVHYSFDLLKVFGLLEGAGAGNELTAYTTDRGKKRPWNDAWGNPLVVAYAVFQPPRCDDTVMVGLGQPKKRDDYYLTQALESYRYNRSVYISLAAAGPKLRAPLTGNWSTDAAAIWRQANDVCNRDDNGTELWQTYGDASNPNVPANAFTAPPWEDIRRGQHRRYPGERPMLSAPKEFK